MEQPANSVSIKRTERLLKELSIEILEINYGNEPKEYWGYRRKNVWIIYGRTKKHGKKLSIKKARVGGGDIIDRLSRERFSFIQRAIIDEIANFDFSNKTIGQFCCNNGRELLSLMGTGAGKGVGFDIAENQVAFANSISKQMNLVLCNI